jgi:hypothetical protein
MCNRVNRKFICSPSMDGAGPEIARLVSECECNFQGPVKENDTHHHEQNTATQTQFLRDVTSLSDAMKGMGNPFIEDSGTLFALDTKNVMSEAVVEIMINMKNVGQDAYDAFVEQRLLRQEKTVTDTIHRPKNLLFNTPVIPKPQSNMRLNLAVLKIIPRCSLVCTSAANPVLATPRTSSDMKISHIHLHCLMEGSYDTALNPTF